MARSNATPRTAYFEGCLKAIRTSDFGRDARRPIADAIDGIIGNASLTLDPLEQVQLQGMWDKLGRRVVAFSLRPITGKPDHYTLVVTRYEDTQ